MNGDLLIYTATSYTCKISYPIFAFLYVYFDSHA